MHFPKFDISKFCIYMYIINVEILKCNIIIDPKFIKKINASREDWTLDPWFTRPVLCHWAIEATLSTIDISKLFFNNINNNLYLVCHDSTNFVQSTIRGKSQGIRGSWIPWWASGGSRALRYIFGHIWWNSGWFEQD